MFLDQIGIVYYVINCCNCNKTEDGKSLERVLEDNEKEANRNTDNISEQLDTIKQYGDYIYRDNLKNKNYEEGSNLLNRNIFCKCKTCAK